MDKAEFKKSASSLDETILGIESHIDVEWFDHELIEEMMKEILGVVDDCRIIWRSRKYGESLRVLNYWKFSIRKKYLESIKFRTKVGRSLQMIVQLSRDQNELLMSIKRPTGVNKDIVPLRQVILNAINTIKEHMREIEHQCIVTDYFSNNKDFMMIFKDKMTLTPTEEELESVD